MAESKINNNIFQSIISNSLKGTNNFNMFVSVPTTSDRVILYFHPNGSSTIVEGSLRIDFAPTYLKFQKYTNNSWVDLRSL